MGYNPIPHIPARSITSEKELDVFLSNLKSAGVNDILAIGGSPKKQEGPFEKTMDIFHTGIIQKYRFREVNTRFGEIFFCLLEIRRFGGGKVSVSSDSTNKSCGRVRKYILALSFRSQYRQQSPSTHSPPVTWQVLCHQNTQRSYVEGLSCDGRYLWKSVFWIGLIPGLTYWEHKKNTRTLKMGFDLYPHTQNPLNSFLWEN